MRLVTATWRSLSRLCQHTQTSYEKMAKSIVNGKRGKHLLQIPVQAKGRCSSASDIPEDSPKETTPQIPQRPWSESDLTEANAQSKATLSRRGHFQTLCNLNERFNDFGSTRRLTEQAKDLSEEEIRSQGIDVFKPLDSYEILFGKMKVTNNETSSEHCDGQ